MGLPALIMLYCGLRRGEVIAFRWDDIDLERGTISVNKAAEYTTSQPTIKKPKTEAGMWIVPVPDIVLDALNKCRKEKGLVCPAADGQTMMSKIAWKRAWESYRTYLNLKAGGSLATRSKPAKWVIGEDLGAHMQRHSYATILYDAGVDVKSAQRYLGHSSVKVTMDVYTHLSKYKKDQSIDDLNGFIAATRNYSKNDEKVVKNVFFDYPEYLATESKIMNFER